jgi:predicted phosphoribosyltransferase
MPVFADRQQAGKVLARLLRAYVRRPEVVVLGLPRGGVPVAAEVARALDAPLDVFVVRKLALPGFEATAMGAIGPSGVTLIDWGKVARFGVSGSAVATAVARERAELCRLEAAYRGPEPPVVLADRIVILVDDGLATGASMRAAVTAVQQRGAARIVVAVPICAPFTCSELREDVDEITCALTPEPFLAVGLWYRDATLTSDDDVGRLLADSRQRAAPPPISSHTSLPL